MRILSIDPGFGRCGVAIVEKDAHGEHVLHSACVETSGNVGFPQRLRDVTNECARLISTFAPKTLVMERLYFNSNQKTAMQVAEVRGAIIYVAACADIPLVEYTPGQVKAAVSGWGRSDKQAVARMVKMLLKIDKPMIDDEVDAIAIALTHLAHVR